MQQLQWLSGCMKDKRKWFWLAMALAVVSAGLCVVFPFITQQITDRVLVGQTLPDGSVQRQTQLLVPLVCVMIGAQLLRSCVRYGMTASLEYVSQNVQQDIRRHLYDNLCTQDAGFYTRYRTGDLMTRLTGDLDMVRHTVCWISYNAVESTCLFLFSMTYLFSVNAALTLLLLAVAPVILACSFLFSRTVYPLYASLREKLSRMNSVAQENIAGNKTVRAFVREAYSLAEILPLHRGLRPAYGAFVCALRRPVHHPGKNDGRRPRRLFADVLGPVGADARAGHLPKRFSAVPHLRRKGH